jgi:hypothetical protein
VTAYASRDGKDVVYFSGQNDSLWRYTVLDLAELEGRSQEATVSLTLIRGASGPFNSPNREVSLARLRQEGGVWKIVEMPYPFWSYEWSYSEKP